MSKRGFTHPSVVPLVHLSCFRKQGSINISISPVRLGRSGVEKTAGKMLKNAKNANAGWTDEGTQSCLPQLTFLTAIFKLGVLHFFLWFLVVGSIVKPMQKNRKKSPERIFFKLYFFPTAYWWPFLPFFIKRLTSFCQ